MYLSKEERALLKEKLLKEAVEDPVEGDGKVPTSDGDNISVEVDGEVITDPETPETTSDNNGSEDALDGYGTKLALTDMLLQAVNDENTTIQYYNSLIAACNQEGFTDIANVIKHINEEENIHVGMLQHAMTTISEQAKTIEDGEKEAEEIMSEDTDASNKVEQEEEEK